MAYSIRFARQVRDHLQSIPAYERAMVLDAIEAQLEHEPSVPTRNRKRLRPNPLAPWELRVSDLRVLYDVDEDEKRVDILVVGRKVHASLWVAGHEVRL